MPSNHRFLTRGLAAGGVLIGLGLCGLPSGELRQRTPSPNSVSSVGFVELKATLLELKRTWNPQGKARVLSKAQPWKEVFEAPLLWILARPGHDLLNEAIYLSGALGMEAAREQIVRFTTKGAATTRAVAVIAGEHLKPWTPEELAEFLDDDSPEVQVAALEVTAMRDEPMEGILDALLSDDKDVRNAALAAIPSVLGPEDLTVLMGMTDQPTHEGAVRILRAFTVVRINEEVEEFLTAKLADPELSVRRAALEGLMTKGSRLANSGAVWALVIDADLPADLRVAAFRCLEKTRSYDLTKVRAQPAFTEPLLTYFAARCRIVSGDREGAGLLLELLNDAGTDEQNQVLAAAGRLLGQVSGTSSGAGIEAWSHWYWYGGPLKTHQLPDPPFGW